MGRRGNEEFWRPSVHGGGSRRVGEGGTREIGPERAGAGYLSEYLRRAQRGRAWVPDSSHH